MPLLSIKTHKIAKKRIFLRADLNVMFKKNKIVDDFRLQSALPTLLYLIKNRAKIILATHLGNPQPGNPDPLLSTKNLIPWFVKQGIAITYTPDLQQASSLERQDNPPVIMLENLRFFPGEKSHDLSFAQQLAHCADIYVNDAFGTMHRNDTSITLLARQFAPANRCIGLCVEQEIAKLDALKNSPQQPLVLVLGGAKLDDKIPLIEQFLKAPATRRPQTIIVGGALALPLLKAQGQATGQVECTAETETIAHTIIARAATLAVKLLVPRDVAAIQGPLGSAATIYSVSQIPANAHVVDIGPDTIGTFIHALRGAGTIFTNGTMGIYEYPAYQAGTDAILQAIAQSEATTIAGGGDCAAAIHAHGWQSSIDFISTGGGATLDYLSSPDPLHQLPGLRALLGDED